MPCFDWNLSLIGMDYCSIEILWCIMKDSIWGFLFYALAAYGLSKIDMDMVSEINNITDLPKNLCKNLLSRTKSLSTPEHLGTKKTSSIEIPKIEIRKVNLNL